MSGNAPIFSERDVRTAEFRLFREAVVSHLVGIATHNHGGIGSGTLLRRGGRHFVLTAHHVIRDFPLSEVSFSLRSPGTLAELGSGVPIKIGAALRWPIKQVLKDAAYDIAALELGIDTVHAPSRFWEWDGTPTDLPSLKTGTSLIYTGFPVSAAIPAGGHVGVVPICDDHARYDPDLYPQNQHRIARTSHDPSAQILIPYLRYLEGIEPYGFSGGGVWCRREAQESEIWQPQNVLIGMVVGYFKTIQSLNVTCLPAVAKMFDAAFRTASSIPHHRSPQHPQRRAAVSERIYMCETKKSFQRGGERTREWVTVPVADIVANRASKVRCKDCHGAVKVHGRNVVHGPAPHVEHKERADSEHCPAGMYFRQNPGRVPRLSMHPVS